MVVFFSVLKPRFRTSDSVSYIGCGLAVGLMASLLMYI
jgi:hypothetical protein